MSYLKLSDFNIVQLMEEVKREKSEEMYILAHKYFYADDVERDFEKGIYWLKKSYKLGNINAMRALGCVYSDDSFGRKNCEKALLLLNTASEQGDIKSKHYLAVMYIYGFCVEKNFIKAYELLNEAYMRGHFLSGVVRNHITTIDNVGLLRWSLKLDRGIILFIIAVYYHFYNSELGENDRLWNLSSFPTLKNIGIYKIAKERANTQLDML